MIGRTVLSCICVLAACCGSAVALPVTVTFQGTIQTVSGTPFGLTSAVQTQPVSGSFTYESATADTDVSATRGLYSHAGGGAFLVNVPGKGIAGSAIPRVVIENFNPDTFRFVDGLPNGQGPMSVNSFPDTSIGLQLAITDNSGAVFNSDALPVSFPFTYTGGGTYPYPHTFMLNDATGTMLIQFTNVTPEPASLTVLAATPVLLLRRRLR